MTLAVDWGEYLIAATALAAVAGMLVSGVRRRRALARLGRMPQLARMTASRSPLRRWLKSAMLVAAVTLCAAAVARPGMQGEVTWQQRGIDVVVVMDFSASMLARDVYPTRLQRMAEEVESLADRLGSDRLGVVVFAGAAAHFPLTHDHRAARSLFRGLTVRDLPPGSDLGAGIATARCVVRPGLRGDPGCQGVGGRGRGGAPLDDQGTQPRHQDLPDRARAVVVFTDGEDTVGQARAEVARAALLGIEMYFVGIGTPQGELVPEVDADGRAVGWKEDEDGAFVTTRLDVNGLRELAGAAGGGDRLLLADPERFITGELKNRLDRLEEGVLNAHRAARHDDLYYWFAFPAFLLLVIEACTGTRRRRSTWPASAPARPGGSADASGPEVRT